MKITVYSEQQQKQLKRQALTGAELTADSLQKAVDAKKNQLAGTRTQCKCNL